VKDKNKIQLSYLKICVLTRSVLRQFYVTYLLPYASD